MIPSHDNARHSFAAPSQHPIPIGFPQPSKRLLSYSGYTAGMMAEAAFTAAQCFAGPSAAPPVKPPPPPYCLHAQPKNNNNDSNSSNNSPFYATFSNLVQAQSSQAPQAPQPAPTLALPYAQPNLRDLPGSNDGGTRYSGMYASTGFDMLSILSRVSNRYYWVGSAGSRIVF